MAAHTEDGNERFLATPPSGAECRGCSACGSREPATADNGAADAPAQTTAVRFGFMRYIGEFARPGDMRFTAGSKLVIQTKRGIEMGEQVIMTCSECDCAIRRQQFESWVEECGENSYIFNAGRILREATAADLAEYVHIQESAVEKKRFAQGVAERLGLPLKVVDCECPFGGERIIFFFRAEERIDFREMVKELAREFRTRIEMRQVGARDEARLLADFETCGQEVCCKTFLKTLKPVSMKMAKLQKATLDPSKVSGRCGRLKCCLRYEHSTYEELDAQLPRAGRFVRTRQGHGVVVNRQIITQLLLIRTADDTIKTVPMEDVYGEGEEPTEQELAEVAEKARAAEIAREEAKERQARTGQDARPTSPPEDPRDGGGRDRKAPSDDSGPSRRSSRAGGRRRGAAGQRPPQEGAQSEGEEPRAGDQAGPGADSSRESGAADEESQSGSDRTRRPRRGRRGRRRRPRGGGPPASGGTPSGE